MSEGTAPTNPVAQTAEAADPNQVTQPGATGESGAQGQSNAIKDAAKEALRKHKLKVDGQEIEVDEEELKRGYSHQRAANKALQEGRALKKQAEDFLKMMKQDKSSLFGVIQKLGYDPRKLAEEYLSSQLEEEMMDPREKDLRDTKARLKQYEELEKKQKEEADKKRDEALKAKFSEKYSAEFAEALKASQLPPTKAMIGEMAKYIHRAAKMNFEMTAKEAAQLVREDIESAHRNLYGEADAETLVKLLGDQGLQKIRGYDTARLKDPNANLRTPTEQPEPSKRVRNQGKRMTPQEWREFNRK